MTIREGITIQLQQINEMEAYLKPEVIRDLRIEASLRNRNMGNGLTREMTGHDVWRGQDLLTWVENNRNLWRK